MYGKLIKTSDFDSIYLLNASSSKIDMRLNTILGSENITLNIEDAKRLRNYLTESINFATMYKEEEK